MGLFGGSREQRGQDGPALPPLSHEALVAVLEAEEYRYSVDSDGDLHGLWGAGDHFYFLQLGPRKEIFQVRGRWNRTLPVSLAADAVELCQEWNRDRIFPKAYTSVGDDGRVRLYGEVSTDFEHGVTPAQLLQVLDCGLATCLQLFEEAQRRFPEQVSSIVPHLDED